MTKSQADRLGERLKVVQTEDDLRLLDQYRAEFTDAFDHIVGTLRDHLNLEPTGRRTKTTGSIVAKLVREKCRLSQIQDIAGCRLVVEEISVQDRLVAVLKELFGDAKVVDRREKPSHGYRAVHVIVTSHKKSVEVQVRTELQQLWAEMSEKYADSVDPAIKYGGGPEWARADLDVFSWHIQKIESSKDREMYESARMRLPGLLRDMISKYEKRGN